MPVKSYKSSIKCPNCGDKGKVNKKISGKFDLYFCSRCGNGFTHPAPLDIEKYYQDHYWTSSSFVGKFKTKVFETFQKRRVSWVTNTATDGSILDIGSGEGGFGKNLPKNYNVTSIEPPGSKVKSKTVIKKDFLKWETKQKFDIVCFWESLEHTAKPQKYLEKAYKLLNKNGKIFIEFPRYSCFERKMFGKYWFHLDLPRHLSHLTDNGLCYLLKKSGFSNMTFTSVPSFDYAPWGYVASTLRIFGIKSTDYVKVSGNILFLILLIPIGIIGLIVEIIFIIIGQSPIGLVTAKKKN